jgi:hypothetical protein
MKQIIRIAFLLLVVAIAFPNEAQAQRKKKKSSKSESSFDLKKQLWYGGGFILGFGSYQNQFSIPASSFQVGVSPMVGYKITPWLSAGPRLDFTYSNERIGNPAFAKYNGFLYGVGPFIRAKTNFKVFGHFEYQLLFLTEKEKNTGEKRSDSTERAFIGVGYNDTAPRGLWGYEIYVTYDVLAPTDGPIPLGYRFGITYNF